MLSVIIITKNEAANIDSCLTSVAWADEIIVVDSGSTDETVAKARKYTTMVYESKWLGFGPQKQLALSYASGDWVLNIDADEVITPDLAEEIQKVTQNSSDIIAWRIPIAMQFYGKILKKSLKTSRHIRLFKRTEAQYSNHIVHENIILNNNAKIGRLQNYIIHNSYLDLSEALAKLNTYSSLTARARLQNNHKYSFGKILVSSMWMFIRTYILQGGFVDGKAGLLLAIYFAQGSFYRGMKQIYPDKEMCHDN